MQHRVDPLIVGAARRRRKRDRDEASLQRSQKCGDVVEALWCQYHRAVAARCAMPKLVCNVQRSPIHLGPSQGFGNASPIMFVINKSKCGVIGLHAGALTQHVLNRRTKHRYLVTFLVIDAATTNRVSCRL